MKRTILQIMLCCVLSWSLAPTNATGASDKPLTNPDIIKMIKAELGEETIVRAIQNGPSNFDTSPDALIALKNGGASQKILNAIVTAKAPKSSDTQSVIAERSPSTQTSASAMVNAAASVNDVFLVDGMTRTRIMRSVGSTETNSRNILLRSIVWYVLPRSHADVQVNTGTPAFEFTLPTDMKAADLVKIQKPDVDRDSRKIEQYMAGAFVTHNSLNKRDVPVVVEELKGEAILGGRMARYRLTPASPLPPGEYFLSLPGGYYDFGIETAK